MLENLLKIHDNMSSIDFHSNISCIDSQTQQSMFSSRENVQENFFSQERCSDKWGPFKNLNSQESHENCLFQTDDKIQTSVDLKHYI